MTGFCRLEVNPPGPLQVYVVPPPEVRLMGALEQEVAPLAVMLGEGLILTVALTVFVHELASLTLNVYTPALVFCTAAIVGF
jgi:hypothetical protein